MSRRRNTLLLPEAPVRYMGMVMIAAGLLLPGSALLWRARRWDPPATVKTPVAARPEMVVLPPGRFQMGSPKDEEERDEDETLHEVVLTSFSLARTEVTQGQFAAVLGQERIHAKEDWAGDSCAKAGLGPHLPVVCVTWDEAVEYCNQLSKLEGLAPYYGDAGEVLGGEGYRLPTEAEWEYAARAGTKSRYVGTDEGSQVCEFANVADETAGEKYGWSPVFPCRDGHSELAPVERGTVRANRWGLLGLGGNAAEWVGDWYGLYEPHVAEDPAGPSRGSGRVFRGGSWGIGPLDARVAIRLRDVPGSRSGLVGFRVARSLPSAP